HPKGLDKQKRREDFAAGGRTRPYLGFQETCLTLAGEMMEVAEAACELRHWRRTEQIERRKRDCRNGGSFMAMMGSPTVIGVEVEEDDDRLDIDFPGNCFDILDLRFVL
ncbi:hypothetical protein CRG98_031628, partial [Punica granatum]